MYLLYDFLLFWAKDTFEKVKICASLCPHVAFFDCHSYLSHNILKDKDSIFLPSRNGIKLYTTETTHFQEKWWDQYSQEITHKPWKIEAHIFPATKLKLDPAIHPAATLDPSAMVSETICLWINWTLRLYSKNMFYVHWLSIKLFQWCARRIKTKQPCPMIFS